MEGAEETAKLARALGAEVHVMRCDVVDPAQVEALAAEADRRFGGSDLIVNNAGVAVAGKIGEVSLDDWRWIVDINMWGVVYGCHAFVPRFRKQGSGHIINVASAAGLLSAPEMGPYNVTKAAVVALSETLYGELNKLGIGVSVLCPTFFRTNIAKSGRMSGDGRAQKHAQHLMDKAKITAEGVARVALEAADDKQLYVIPQADGRWLWRLKRAAPATFYAGIGKVIDRAMRMQENS